MSKKESIKQWTRVKLPKEVGNFVNQQILLDEIGVCFIEIS